MAECPTCDDSFKNTHGMRIHHVQAHGESLADDTITCEQCGDDFHVQRDKAEKRRFCSRECEGNWRSDTFVGEDHPRYNRETTTCDNCGETIERPPSVIEQYEHDFCDDSCRTEWVADELSERRTGENNPMFGQTGEDHPNWRGGYGQNYGEGWTDARRRTLERDGYECQDCGMDRETHRETFDYDLEVHHIQPFRTFSDAATANQLSNLITLCTTCHQKRENRI